MSHCSCVVVLGQEKDFRQTEMCQGPEMGINTKCLTGTEKAASSGERSEKGDGLESLTPVYKKKRVTP